MFCLPSHQENFALGVTEALACGLPVLISNKVNIWREIDSDCAGFIGNDDLSGTVQCLERWLCLSIDQQDAMRHRAQRCFDRNFKIEAAAHRLVQALRDHDVGSRPSSMNIEDSPQLISPELVS